MIPYLLAADVQNTLLAAVLTFSDRVLYPFYEFHSRALEAAALDDQVLAGVIMWVPMSLAYLVPAALLTIRMLSPTDSGPRIAPRRLMPPLGPGISTRRIPLRRLRHALRGRLRMGAVSADSRRGAPHVYEVQEVEGSIHIRA